MTTIVDYATLQDINQIIDFIRSVYDVSVAPHYSDQGNAEFYKYLDPQSMAERLESNHIILQATFQGELMGVIEIRDNNHLSMLFVKTNKQRHGIGRNLLSFAIKTINENNPNQKTLMVHSSPNSVTAYEKMGFESLGEEQTVNGIRFTTMQMHI
jgi:predicted GNAT family N-acyltransferase